MLYQYSRCLGGREEKQAGISKTPPLNLLFQILQFERGEKVPNKYPIELSKLLYKLSIRKSTSSHKIFQTLFPPHNSLSKHSLIPNRLPRDARKFTATKQTVKKKKNQAPKLKSNNQTNTSKSNQIRIQFSFFHFQLLPKRNEAKHTYTQFKIPSTSSSTS